MKEILLMYARSTKQTNATVLALLDGLSNEGREADSKGYYKSLSGTARHVLDGTLYFHGLFRASIPTAGENLKASEGLAIPEGALTSAQWEGVKTSMALADQATVDLFQSIGEADCSQPIKLDWYGGKPATVPLYFLAHQLFEHGTHHRGQISQMLDELGVEHDFCGISLECLPE